jgi:hypothetical protein
LTGWDRLGIFMRLSYWPNMIKPAFDLWIGFFRRRRVILRISFSY